MMSNHVTPEASLTANENSTESLELFNELSHNEDRNVFNANDRPLYTRISKDIIHADNITAHELRVYLVILGYCGSLGVCFRSTKSLHADFPLMEESVFRKHCASLEKKGFLYRQQISQKKGGSRRNLVAKCKWKLYHEFLIKKKYFKNAAKLESYFTSLPIDYLIKKYNQELALKEKKSPIPEPTQKVDSSKDQNIPNRTGTGCAVDSEQARDARSNNTYSIINRKNELDDSLAPLSSSFQSPFTASDDSMLNQLIKEFPNESPTLIKSFIESKKDLLKKVDSPKSYVAGAIRKGALGNIQQKQAKKEKETNEANNEFANKKYAEGLKAHVEGLSKSVEEFTFTVIVYPVSILMLIKRHKEYEANGSSDILYTDSSFFKDSDFKRKVALYMEKVNEKL